MKILLMKSMEKLSYQFGHWFLTGSWLLDAEVYLYVMLQDMIDGRIHSGHHTLRSFSLSLEKKSSRLMPHKIDMPSRQYFVLCSNYLSIQVLLPIRQHLYVDALSYEQTLHLPKQYDLVFQWFAFQIQMKHSIN